jgi:hypothetical protein
MLGASSLPHVLAMAFAFAVALAFLVQRFLCKRNGQSTHFYSASEAGGRRHIPRHPGVSDGVLSGQKSTKMCADFL